MVRRQRKVVSALGLFGIILIGSWLACKSMTRGNVARHFYGIQQTNNYEKAKYFCEGESLPELYDSMMLQITKSMISMLETRPNVPPLVKYDRRIIDDTNLHKSEIPPTSTVLGMYLQVPEETVKELKATHVMILSGLPDSVMPGAFKGRGIVLTGGGAYFPMVMSAIRWVREVNSSIPIEVFLRESEYEHRVCSGLFREIGVHCRIFEDIYGENILSQIESRYALKPLALLASRFEDIYFMDADSYPLCDVNKIFDSDVFNRTGYILSSDFWPRYISPRFYDVVGIQLGGRRRGNADCDVLLQSDREGAVSGKSTESGQIFVRKTSHIKSLLLAMYYNLLGPQFYFPLLTQGGHGEGDKDTYAAAAVVAGEDYYQNHRGPVPLGMHDGVEYRSYAMLQPNPIFDEVTSRNNGEGETEEYVALHSNTLKANPKYLLQSHFETGRGYQPLRQWRLFGSLKTVLDNTNLNEDIESRLFSVMKDVACEWIGNRGFVPTDWNDTNIGRLCGYLNSHLEWLRHNKQTEPASNASYWIDLRISNE